MKWIFSDLTYTDMMDKLHETDVVNCVEEPIRNDDVMFALIDGLLRTHNDLTETARELHEWFEIRTPINNYSSHDLAILVMECGIEHVLTDTQRILERVGSSDVRLLNVTLGPTDYTVTVDVSR